MKNMGPYIWTLNIMYGAGHPTKVKMNCQVSHGFAGCDASHLAIHDAS
jgi:hypothetical protein